MASSDQYQAIPAGEPTQHFHATPSGGGRKKLMYAIGAVLLVFAIVVVTAHVTSDQYTYGSPYMTRLTSRAFAPRYLNYYRQPNSEIREYGRQYDSALGLHARHYGRVDNDHSFTEYAKMRPVSVDHVPAYGLHARHHGGHHGGHHGYGVDHDYPLFGREYYRRYNPMI